MYTEQFRRRVAAEAGFENSMMVSYSQDHEGYLMIPEDWLLGEYEADIVPEDPAHQAMQLSQLQQQLLASSDGVDLSDLPSGEIQQHQANQSQHYGGQHQLFAGQTP